MDKQASRPFKRVAIWGAVMIAAIALMIASPAFRPDKGVQAASTHKQSNDQVDKKKTRPKSANPSRKKSAKSSGNQKQTRSASVSWVKLGKLYPGAFITNGPRGKKRVALTFDDAPDSRVTPQILEILSNYHVRATFFLVGNKAANHPQLVKRILKEGHVIGNHSYNHAIFSKLTNAQFQNQIWRTDKVINQISGVSPRLIRPPYGDLLPHQVAWSRANGFTMVNWDVDSEDWKKNPSSALVLANIKRTLQPGSIVLQHAGGGEGQYLSGTIRALPDLIEMLQDKGYEIVTLPELLGKKAYR
ncbi:polysaccharide deacetylase family protein [Paenibacillus sp. GCM10027627]|uniref:polysaccharide deacetylase family protein n=1 Tax=unclassified Paenibacillus TaxID=185978 RepID=UPI003636C3E6